MTDRPRNFFLCVLLFICLPRLCAAGGRYAGASLELGVGARPLALAGAAAALSGRAETFYYNPASLALLKRPMLSLMYAPTFGSIRSPMANYHHAGLTLPLPGGGTAALNWTRFSVDDIPIYPALRGRSFPERDRDITLRPDGTALGYFQDTEDVFYFSFARPFNFELPLGWLYIDLPIEIPVGLNLKLLRQSLYDASTSGLGVDLGVMIRFSLGTLLEKNYLGRLCLGVSAIDLTQTSVIWSTKHQDRIHRTVLLGLAYEHRRGLRGAVLRLYYTQRSKYEITDLFGGELAYRGLAVRLGYNGSGLTAGAGFGFWRLLLDYAFVATDFDDLHRMSCALRL